MIAPSSRASGRRRGGPSRRRSRGSAAASRRWPRTGPGAGGPSHVSDRVDVLVVSLGTTRGLRLADAQLVDMLREAGASVAAVATRIGLTNALRRAYPVNDVVEAIAARRALRDGLPAVPAASGGVLDDDRGAAGGIAGGAVRGLARLARAPQPRGRASSAAARARAPATRARARADAAQPGRGGGAAAGRRADRADPPPIPAAPVPQPTPGSRSRSATRPTRRPRASRSCARRGSGPSCPARVW